MLNYNAAIPVPPRRDTMGTAGNQRKWREMAFGSPGAREYLLPWCDSPAWVPLPTPLCFPSEEWIIPGRLCFTRHCFLNEGTLSTLTVQIKPRRVGKHLPLFQSKRGSCGCLWSLEIQGPALHLAVVNVGVCIFSPPFASGPQTGGWEPSANLGREMRGHHAPAPLCPQAHTVLSCPRSL